MRRRKKTPEQLKTGVIKWKKCCKILNYNLFTTWKAHYGISFYQRTLCVHNQKKREMFSQLIIVCSIFPIPPEEKKTKNE